jgi:hypothetical protein
MAVLADPGSALLAALVVFLVSLGLLVLFVETMSRARIVAILVANGIVAGIFIAWGEAGLGLAAAGFAAAVLANEAFERLTTG